MSQALEWIWCNPSKFDSFVYLFVVESVSLGCTYQLSNHFPPEIKGLMP